MTEEQTAKETGKRRSGLWILGGIIALLALFAFLPRCNSPKSYAQNAPEIPKEQRQSQASPADINILFVGNSHTQYHNLPEIVRDMVKFLHPKKTVRVRAIGVTFLEDAATQPECRTAIETAQWNYIVLQAQKISQSGRYNYSKAEGIDIARLGKKHGASVFFYSEWGVVGIPDHTARIEKIYQEMADASGAQVVPVGRAWDFALAERPTLPLYQPDGNHQTELGAFLTACTLTSAILKESPAPLAAFPYAPAKEANRKLLANAAAKVWKKKP